MAMALSGMTWPTLAASAADRWWKTPEIHAILSRRDEFGLTVRLVALPHCPGSGDWFVVDKSILKQWRKDGHVYRTRKDGSSVIEHHERLKVDGVDALNAVYSYSESGLCRRAYSLLDAPNVILVHYRDLTHEQGWKRARAPVSFALDAPPLLPAGMAAPSAVGASPDAPAPPTAGAVQLLGPAMSSSSAGWGAAVPLAATAAVPWLGSAVGFPSPNLLPPTGSGASMVLPTACPPAPAAAVAAAPPGLSGAETRRNTKNIFQFHCMSRCRRPST